VTETIDWNSVAAIWRTSGRKRSTIAAYEYWARRYVVHCVAEGRHPLDCLTRAQVGGYAGLEVPVARQRRRRQLSVPLLRSAVRALWCALVALGHKLPPWGVDKSKPKQSLLVQSFVDYRLRHHGVARSTLPHDARLAVAFLGWLRQRKRSVAGIRVVDVDALVTDRGRKFAPKTVSGICSTSRPRSHATFATAVHPTHEIARCSSIIGCRMPPLVAPDLYAIG